ncbi:daptide biosynthesis intramembrane metalloprotease [Kitasatospora sp. NPDC057936]|uniref:daptide biosynthesis intramembrane metalloprotease n=1 Tax=Kitasatospora sp. NPDC057936 TaxID=3346283 RepID=UPI0036D8E56D
MGTATAAPVPDVPARPQVRPGIELIAPENGERAWTAADHDSGRFTRLGAGAATLLQGLDGTRDLDRLRADLAPSVPAEVLDTALRRFTDLGLLTGTAPESPGNGRFQYRRPAALQFTVFRRPGFLAPGRPLPRLMANRVSTALCGAAVFAGLAVVLSGAVRISEAAWRPQPWQYWAIAMGVVIAVNGLHELAHGACLARYGGHARRIGVMLLYLTPAMFCDVTDVWRLRDRRQRVMVALAGVTCQLGCAGVLALGSAVTAGAACDLLGVCATMTTFAGLFNLLPFIKLDGYIALMAWVDIPNLREKSMADVRALAGWVAFGGPRPARTLADGWAVYGAVCLLFPWLLLGNLLIAGRAALIGFGPMGALSWLCLLAALALHIAVRLFHAYRASGARTPLRGLLALGAGAAVLAGLAHARPYTETEYGAYTVTGDGVRLLLPDAPGVRAPQPGGEVSLMHLGILGRQPVGTAVTGTSMGTETVPAEPFLPVTGIPGSLSAKVYTLSRPTGAEPGDQGMAVVATGSTDLLTHLARAAVLDPWRLVVGG